MPVTRKTLHIHITRNDVDQTPANGRVTLTGPYVLRDGSGNIVLGRPSAYVDLVDGEGTLSLPTSDNPDLSPSGWTYTAVVATDVWRETFEVEIPHAGSGTIEFADLAPAVTPTTVATYALLGHTHTTAQVTGLDTTIAALDARLDAIEGGGGGGGVPTSRLVSAGTGLTGGGSLAADRTLALSAGTVTSLGKADTAVQPGALAAVATSGSYADLTGTPTGSGDGDLDLYPPDAAGFVAWSCDPSACSADFAHNGGVLLMIRFRYRGDAATISELGFAVASAASSPGAYSGVALYEDGVGLVNRLGQSADSGSSWTTQGVKSIALGSPVAVVRGSYYRAALLWQGSSPGRITGTPAAVLDTQLNAGVLRSTYLAGQTGFPASITMSSMNINSAVYFIAAK